MAQDTKCRHHIRDRFQFRDKESGGFRDGFTVPDGWRELKNEEMSLRTFHSRCQSLTKTPKAIKQRKYRYSFKKQRRQNNSLNQEALTRLHALEQTVKKNQHYSCSIGSLAMGQGLGIQGLSTGHMEGQTEHEGWKGRLESFTEYPLPHFKLQKSGPHSHRPFLTLEASAAECKIIP